MKEGRVIHELPPVYREDSAVLVLGTIPSPKSREAGFYYSHPQNRFWRVMAALFEEPLPADNAQKQALVLRHQIALWDVLAECEIAGASDSSIRQERPNDLGLIFSAAPIRMVFTTGKKAEALYRKHCYPVWLRESICLPSTSPANCACPLPRLIEAYRVLLDYCE